MELRRRGAIGWRWIAAFCCFGFALMGLVSGVGLSDRPDVGDAGILTKAYYSLGLFVVGGLDLGVPSGGPLTGRIMLWLAYFGAPLLTASAVIEALFRVISPQRWQLRRLSGHIVIVGAGDLTISYLRVVRRERPKVAVVVVDEAVEPVRELELEESFGVRVVVGDITHDFLLHALRLDNAAKIVLLGDDDFQSYEAASKILDLYPAQAHNIVLHCHNLRFMRAMQHTSLARQTTTFNSYHLAAIGLVRDRLLAHFKKTRARDIVVIAGFGRFGQTILEELQNLARQEIAQVALIDIDADRRVLVAEEQQRLAGDYPRQVFQGDIAHPEVWQMLANAVDLSRDAPVVILGTGRPEQNLRTALWLKQTYPNALVFVRTNDVSNFATQVGAEHAISSISITQLVEQNIPVGWVR